MDKLTFLTQHLQLLAELAAHLQEQIASAQDGAKERAVSQIMGNLYGLQWFWWLEKNKVSFLDYQIATIQVNYLFGVI